MNKTIQYSVWLFLSLFVISIASAQNQVIQIDELKPQIVDDAALSQRLEIDLRKRNFQVQNETIIWYELNEGFYGAYTVNETNYMALYDLKENYILTMVQKQWSNKIPNPLKSSFDLSHYKLNEVTSYWEVSGLGKRSYYMELKDKEGKVSRVWANEKGDFSTSIPQRQFR